MSFLVKRVEETLVLGARQVLVELDVTYTQFMAETACIRTAGEFGVRVLGPDGLVAQIFGPFSFVQGKHAEMLIAFALCARDVPEGSTIELVGPR